MKSVSGPGRRFAGCSSVRPGKQRQQIGVNTHVTMGTLVSPHRARGGNLWLLGPTRHGDVDRQGPVLHLHHSFSRDAYHRAARTTGLIWQRRALSLRAVIDRSREFAFAPCHLLNTATQRVVRCCGQGELAALAQRHAICSSLAVFARVHQHTQKGAQRYATRTYGTTWKCPLGFDCLATRATVADCGPGFLVHGRMPIKGGRKQGQSTLPFLKTECRNAFGPFVAFCH